MLALMFYNVSMIYMPEFRKITGMLRFVLQLFAIGLAGVLHAQTLADITNAPTPGTNDIYQLSTQGNQTAPDGLNYYTDNQISYGTGEPGQTFTTGTNATGYVLTSVAVRTGGIGASYWHQHSSALLFAHLFGLGFARPRCCKPIRPATSRSATATG